MFDASTQLTLYTALSKLLRVVAANGGYRSMVRNMYNASFATIANRLYPFVDASVMDPHWRANAFDFCDGECNLLVVRSLGMRSLDHSLTESYTQLPDGACTASGIYSIPSAQFQRLIETPPARVTEKYYKCSPFIQDAFNDAVGIGSGNASTLVPVLFALLLPALYMWLDYVGHIQSAPEYDETEKEETMEHLLNQLLRAKEGKTRAMKATSPVLQLHQAMDAVTKERRRSTLMMKNPEKFMEQMRSMDTVGGSTSGSMEMVEQQSSLPTITLSSTQRTGTGRRSSAATGSETSPGYHSIQSFPSQDSLRSITSNGHRPPEDTHFNKQNRRKFP